MRHRRSGQSIYGCGSRSLAIPASQIPKGPETNLDDDVRNYDCGSRCLAASASDDPKGAHSDDAERRDPVSGVQGLTSAVGESWRHPTWVLTVMASYRGICFRSLMIWPTLAQKVVRQHFLNRANLGRSPSVRIMTLHLLLLIFVTKSATARHWPRLRMFDSNMSGSDWSFIRDGR